MAEVDFLVEQVGLNLEESDAVVLSAEHRVEQGEVEIR